MKKTYEVNVNVDGVWCGIMGDASYEDAFAEFENQKQILEIGEILQLVDEEKNVILEADGEIIEKFYEARLHE